MGKKTTFKENFCNGCHCFPCAASCCRAGELIFSRMWASSTSLCQWMYSLRRNLAAVQGTDSLETRPIIWVSFINWSFWIHSKISHLKRGWQWKRGTDGHRRRQGGGGETEESLFVVSFMGTNLQVDTSVALKAPGEAWSTFITSKQIIWSFSNGWHTMSSKALRWHYARDEGSQSHRWAMRLFEPEHKCSQSYWANRVIGDCPVALPIGQCH